MDAKDAQDLFKVLINLTSLVGVQPSCSASQAETRTKSELLTAARHMATRWAEEMSPGLLKEYLSCAGERTPPMTRCALEAPSECR